MIKRKGLAQIPLMIGLLIMAVAVPVATKLVQESQDTRNRAASVITTTPPPSGCTEGYVRCFNNVQQRCQNGSWVFQKNCPNGCSGNYCKTTPTSTPTKKPPTSTPRPPTPTPNPCSVSTERPNNCTCTYSNQCESGYCAGGTVCLPKPTATPNPNACNQVYENTKCVNSAEYTCTNNVWVKTKTCTGPCVNNACPKAPTNTPTKRPPTATPNPNACNQVYENTKCVNSAEYTCTNNVWVKTKTCTGPCVNNACPKAPTNTPTKRPPTATPNPNACNQVYENTKCVNSAEYTCTNNVWVKTKTCTGPCVNNACPAAPLTCIGTAGSGVCRSNGCLSGETDGGQGNCSAPGIRCCAPKSPTPISCKYGKCESGDEGMTKCVNNAQYFCDGDCYVWVKNCPNGCSGNFCKTTPTSTPTKKPPTNTPTPTGPLKCYCMDNCGSYDCNWQSAAGGGYNRYCTADYCSYVPTPRQPTATPTKACSKTGGTCNSQGDCCPGNVCWNGHCYLSSGPTQVPTTNPTGTYPTSGPIPTTKPPVGDKCPGAEACPNPSNKNLLQNCTPPDSDGTPNDTLCTKAGMIEPCGGKSYCCPSAGGAWTSDMTKCIGTVTLIPTKIPTAIPTNPPDFLCTQCPGKPQAKLKGDADCDGEITINDYQIWIDEFRQGNYGGFNKNTWRSDFDCDGLVSLNDYQIWIDNFKIIQ